VEVTETEPLLELDLPAVPASCARGRRDVGAAVAGRGLDSAAVALAVSEAVTNVVVHAYRDREPEAGDGRVHIRVSADASGIWIRVSDEGVGMSPRDDSPGLGVGLSVIATVTDQLLILQGDTGTRVHMRFEFPAAASEARS
jgi:anti-sigma regulatory factor (Ser/Thr protein kinase)